MPKDASGHLIPGRIEASVDALPNSLPHIRAGAVRALAVLSGARTPTLPDVPTVGETIAGFEVSGWTGIGVPRGTPDDVVARLNRELNEISVSPDVRTLLDPDGARPATMSPADYASRIKSDFAQWKRIATDRKIVTE